MVREMRVGRLPLRGRNGKVSTAAIGLGGPLIRLQNSMITSLSTNSSPSSAIQNADSPEDPGSAFPPARSPMSIFDPRNAPTTIL